jgi:hypothetical protein
MLGQFLVGSLASVANITIHDLVMPVVVRVAKIMSTKYLTRSSVFLAGVMIATVSILMIAHTVEVFVWALFYSIVGAAPAGSRLIYFAFVNYTTLGYGDVIPAENWHLLGPMAAMNGILLFGWSTAVVFEVLRRAMSLHSQVRSAE